VSYRREALEDLVNRGTEVMEQNYALLNAPLPEGLQVDDIEDTSTDSIIPMDSPAPSNDDLGG
jgi:hypothetical protein